MKTGSRTDDPRIEAKHVARSALLWTTGIAIAKLVVGILTGSVAVLGDALHSVLDVAITGLTFFAVRLAAKPPDANHPYGHGRAENLAALAQGVVMLGVAAVIALAAWGRIETSAEVDAPFYSFAVMVGTLGIGIWRAQVLRAAAKRLSSPAIGADATNITADIAETVAVLVGLATARFGFDLGDPIAAFVVVGVMAFMGVRIAWSSVNVVMDLAPADLTEALTRATSVVPGVVDVRSLRVRRSGADVHAEVIVSVGRTSSVEQSHEITEAVEVAVANAVPGATATVHVEPSRRGEDVVARTFAAANRIGMGDQVHNVLAIRHPEGLWLMLHAQVPPTTPLGDAHHFTDELERELRSEIAGLARVEIHVEPHEQMLSGTVVSAERERLTRDVRKVAESKPPISRCHEVAVSQTADGVHLVLHCEAPASTTIAEVHDASLRVEDEIHRRYPDVRSITVHFEPQGVS